MSDARLLAVGEDAVSRVLAAYLKRCQTTLDWADAVSVGELREAATAELAKRRYTWEQTEAWGLGLDDGTARDGLDPEALRHCGLVDRDYPVMTNRLIFPIHDWLGGLVGFVGRRLVGDPVKVPKWVYPADSPGFSRGNFVYNLHQAAETGRKRNFLILVEGANDVRTLELAGVANTVQCLGTVFTRRQASLLRRFVRRVVLLMDPDLAGRRASDRGRVLLEAAGLEVSVAQLEKWDPDETVRQVGVGPVLDAVRKALRG